MCHEILYFFLFLPIKNVKLSLDSWAIRNQKARGVGWRTTMHYPPCIIPNNVYRNKPQVSIKFRFKYLDVSLISLLIPSSKPSTDTFWSLAHQTPPLLAHPPPPVQLAVPWMFLIKIYPCQKTKQTKKPCPLQFFTNPTSPNWCEAPISTRSIFQ